MSSQIHSIYYFFSIHSADAQSREVVITIFKKVVRPHFSKSRKTKQYSNENSDRGYGRGDHSLLVHSNCRFAWFLDGDLIREKIVDSELLESSYSSTPSIVTDTVNIQIKQETFGKSIKCQCEKHFQDGTLIFPDEAYDAEETITFNIIPEIIDEGISDHYNDSPWINISVLAFPQPLTGEVLDIESNETLTTFQCPDISSIIEAPCSYSAHDFSEFQINPSVSLCQDETPCYTFSFTFQNVTHGRNVTILFQSIEGDAISSSIIELEMTLPDDEEVIENHVFYNEPTNALSGKNVAAIIILLIFSIIVVMVTFAALRKNNVLKCGEYIVVQEKDDLETAL